MADLDAVLEQLRTVRKCAEGELKQLEKVIAQLSKVKIRVPQASLRSGDRMKRQLSAAGRERVGATQRRRWAKVRSQSRKALSVQSSRVPTLQETKGGRHQLDDPRVDSNRSGAEGYATGFESEPGNMLGGSLH